MFLLRALLLPPQILRLRLRVLHHSKPVQHRRPPLLTIRILQPRPPVHRRRRLNRLRIVAETPLRVLPTPVAQAMVEASVDPVVSVDINRVRIIDVRCSVVFAWHLEPGSIVFCF